jgi:hypothetical protein
MFDMRIETNNLASSGAAFGGIAYGSAQSYLLIQGTQLTLAEQGPNGDITFHPYTPPAGAGLTDWTHWHTYELTLSSGSYTFSIDAHQETGPAALLGWGKSPVSVALTGGIFGFTMATAAQTLHFDNLVVEAP